MGGKVSGGGLAATAKPVGDEVDLVGERFGGDAEADCLPGIAELFLHGLDLEPEHFKLGYVGAVVLAELDEVVAQLVDLLERFLGGLGGTGCGGGVGGQLGVSGRRRGGLDNFLQGGLGGVALGGGLVGVGVGGVC